MLNPIIYYAIRIKASTWGEKGGHLRLRLVRKADAVAEGKKPRVRVERDKKSDGRKTGKKKKTWPLLRLRLVWV